MEWNLKNSKNLPKISKRDMPNMQFRRFHYTMKTFQSIRIANKYIYHTNRLDSMVLIYFKVIESVPTSCYIEHGTVHSLGVPFCVPYGAEAERQHEDEQTHHDDRRRLPHGPCETYQQHTNNFKYFWMKKSDQRNSI